MKIYTKNGDNGETQLLGGTKVSKDNLRLQCYDRKYDQYMH